MVWEPIVERAAFGIICTCSWEGGLDEFLLGQLECGGGGKGSSPWNIRLICAFNDWEFESVDSMFNVLRISRGNALIWWKVIS